MKGKAVLFGLNYNHCKQGKLKGCINDVFNMAKFIHGILDIPIELYTDDTDIKSTSYDGIVSILHKLAIDSYKENLEFVWLHFSGHGSQQKDTSGDEEDGMDEGLVPSDYERKGILIDDIIHKMISSFNPKTKILFICDTCHSGSILDLKYSWGLDKQCKIDNKKNTVRSNTMLISGCMDNQTSADAYNLLNDNKSVGALSATILKILSNKPEKIYNAFSLVNSVRNELKKRGYSQIPLLSTNYDISENSSLIPVNHVQTQSALDPPESSEVSKPVQQPQVLYVKPSNQPQQYVKQQYVQPQQYVKHQYVQPQQYAQQQYVQPQQYAQQQYVQPQQYVKQQYAQPQKYAQQQYVQPQQYAQQQYVQPQQYAQQQYVQPQQYYVSSGFSQQIQKIGK
jgi:metacaspase-1